MNDQPDNPSDQVNPTTETRAELRKRMLFLSFLLGTMVGVGAFLVIAAIQKQKFALLAVIIALVVTAIPLGKALVELREKYRSAR